MTSPSAAPRTRRRLLVPVVGGLFLLSVAASALLLGRAPGSDAGVAAGFQQMFEACDDTDCAVGVVRAAVDELGPRETLEAYSATAPESFGGVDCHEVMHELGRLSWRADGRGAWFAYPSTCNFGYYHGVMFEAAENVTLDEFAPLAMDLCEASRLPVDVLPPRECSHGFGHAVVDLTGDVASASAACEAFPLEDMRRRCNEGVAKETLNRRQSADRSGLLDCSAWPALRTGVCEYIGAAYTVLYTPEAEFASLASMCRALSAPDECLAGVGRGLVMRAVVSGFSEPGAWASVACGGERACAEGFGRLVFFVRNDRQWSFGQCEPLGALASACRSGVANTEESI